MAKTAMKVKQQRKQKFSTREYNRCRICGVIVPREGDNMVSAVFASVS